MNTSTPFSSPKYRPDIDGLRAMAVLSVVAFHAFPAWIRGGFIGVDIFFVISGFLISTIIFENLEKGTFSFREFYARRIKRIFPALILVLTACFAFGWFTLLADEYQQLGKHMAAGAGFISNFVLWSEVGYFDNSADTKPLLHLWSLGIEEQFYMLWPLVLWAAWKKKFNLLSIAILFFIVSFVLNIKGVKTDPTTTFYLPHTRFWELLAGSILAWFHVYRQKPPSAITLKLDRFLATLLYRHPVNTDGDTLRNLASFLGFALLLFGFWRIHQDIGFPGKWALVPVLGAVLIILAGAQAWINRAILSNKLVVWFGLISFPLYLWHWPLLSFARIIEGETPSKTIRLAAVLIAIALAWFTYRFVERYVRYRAKHNRIVTTCLVLSVCFIGSIGIYTYISEGIKQRLPIIIQNLGKVPWDISSYRVYTCFLEKDQDYTNFEKCKVETGLTDNSSTLLLWGDSHAAHLYLGLKIHYGEQNKIIQRTASGCPAIFNFESSVRPFCKDTNIYLRNMLNDFIPDKVVIASAWNINQINNVQSTINTLKKLGVAKIVLVGPVPRWKEQPTKIIWKEYLSNKFSPLKSRILDDNFYETKKTDEEFRLLANSFDSSVEYVSPFSILCNAEGCLTLDQSGYPLTIDTSHLSEKGSEFLVSMFPKF